MTTAPAISRPLPGPFDTPPSTDALQPSAATLGLVRSQVDALLSSTPSFHSLAAREQANVRDDLVKISGYAAECMRDICWQSRQLGQTPVVRQRNDLVRAQDSAADAFRPAAAGQIARVTQETLRAIAFPTFVADLIRGTFNAITQTNIQQMEAFMALLQNVGGTVDQFMQSNISDNQARDWLQQRYPEHIQVRDGRLSPRDGADDRPAPDFRVDLHLNDSVSIDESSLEETLLPAARRRLAETRLQLLSTLVLMGVNRIVVTGGKIRATMGFHIDTTDRAHEEHATDLDTRAAAAGSFGFGPWSASASMSVSYVRSTRGNSDAELNVETDLTGEVEIHFKSDYFPLARFADGGTIGRIQGNTAVPEANAPFGDAPQTGGDVGRFQSPRTHRAPRQQPALPAIGSPLPEARTPVRPASPQVERRVEAPQTPAHAPAGNDTPAGEGEGTAETHGLSARRFR